ncbi:DnaB-like helicase C-terminal domain-containing protein [Helicobacter salomonis]|uniref:DnaB-like helicase C-terminal domain-containing protein n=1 Tax=Helicobacter salomonis TaxID=56878 RepID=UPI000CF0A706|nr:DnaB-like helicase C-terminal domain-containing protein [Helicobacter salomonis]
MQNLENLSVLDEKIVVSSAIAYPEYVEAFLEGIDLKYFEPLHQEVLKAILSLDAQNAQVSLETICLELGQKIVAQDAFKALLSIEPIPDYLHLKEQLKKSLMLKVQRQLGYKLIEASNRAEIFDAEFLDKYIHVENKTAQAPTLSQWIERGRNTPRAPRFATGIQDLDKLLGGGLDSNGLVLIGGDPEAGKTLLATQILEHMALSTKVLFYSFEFSVPEYVDALQAKGFQLDPDWYRINDTASHLSDLVISMKNYIKQGYKVFLVDSQGFTHNERADMNVEQAETEKFITLRNIAKQHEVLIMLIVQNNKTEKDSP